MQTMSEIGPLHASVSHSRSHFAPASQYEHEYRYPPSHVRCSSPRQSRHSKSTSFREQQQQVQQQPLKSPSSTAATSSTRRRISKACDRCNQLRTKCDGLVPCKHCIENNLECTYVRQRKKRGKISKKDLAREEAQRDNKSVLPDSSVPRHVPSTRYPLALQSSSLQDEKHGVLDSSHYLATAYAPLQNGQIQSQAQIQTSMGSFAWDDRFTSIPSPSTQDRLSTLNLDGTRSECSLQSLPRHVSNTASSAPSVASSFSVHVSPGELRYPVLQPIAMHLYSIMPQTLAAELLEHYFSTSSARHPHPRSPYIVTFMFGRRAFLRQNQPRVCSPALLSSMLWVAARTSDAKFLTASPSSRTRVCQRLFDLTVRLLRPLLHRPSDPSPVASTQDCSFADLDEHPDSEGIERRVNGGLDDVATYIHLGTVISAGEQKGASLRWWTAAWGLARELRLGRELSSASCSSTRPTSSNQGEPCHTTRTAVTEEEREERRRVWWLLFCMDRHLSLCYNKPISLPDRECESLMQPMDEHLWQARDHNYVLAYPSDDSRPCGPPVEYSGPSLFGMFLPLMVILGGVVDLNHARSHPRSGTNLTTSGLWDEQAKLINVQLDKFEESMRAHELQQLAGSPSSSSYNGAPRVQTFDSSADMHMISGVAFRRSAKQPSLSSHGTQIQEAKAMAYARHLLHVLHILLNGRWDPLALLDDIDMWVYSQSFVVATGHAVSAAHCVGCILEHDPDMSFMPFVFGIYLLQGSFLLLLIADKLQRNADPDIVEACETIVRAHEACAVTLSTEYQRNFRNAMRSALSQVKGQASVDDCGEEQRRRRELLSLYRWTGDGTGLDTE